MGFDEPCFRESDDQIAAQAFTGAATTAGYDWQQVRKRGWWRLNVPAPYAPFARGGFPTPSGRCEFHSGRLATMGLDAVPNYVEPYECAASAPELARRFPLSIISPPARNFLNSSFVNVRSLRDTEGEPHLEIHPDDAGPRGIFDGDRVNVFNYRGRLNLKARVSDRARQGVVVALSVWWRKLAPDGRNANELTHQRLTDMGRAPTFYDCLVQVQRAEPA